MRKVVLSLLALLFTIAASAQDKKFSIDNTITGFVNESHEGGMYMYTLKPFSAYGPEDVFPSISITDIPEEMSIQSAIQQIEEEMEKGKSAGDQFKDYKKEDITVNGYKATTLFVKAVEGGGETQVYMAFIEAKGQRLIFIGEDTENGKYIDNIKATLKTLKLK